MQNYFILPTLNPAYLCVVVGTGYARPSEYLQEVELDLARKEIGTGKVLFDLLLANGPGVQRFFTVEFKDGKLQNWKHLESAKEKQSANEAAANELQARLDELDLDLLMPEVREAVQNGRPVY